MRLGRQAGNRAMEKQHTLEAYFFQYLDIYIYTYIYISIPISIYPYLAAAAAAVMAALWGCLTSLV